MGGYLFNFIVYTAAMVGIIFLAVFVYKKFSFCAGSKSAFLNVEDCITLAPRKDIYIIRAGNERFLVASDAGRTSLISKLNDNSSPAIQKSSEKCSIDELPTIVDFPKISKGGQKKIFKNIINNI